LKNHLYSSTLKIQFLAMQKANLVQILAALSNVTDGIENQRIFLNAALSDVIVFFESEEFKT
jgi:hypothetical protein